MRGLLRRQRPSPDGHARPLGMRGRLPVVASLRLRTGGWSQNPEGLSIAGHPTKSPAVAPLRDRVPRPMVPTGVSHECLSFPCDISTNTHLREEELLAEVGR